MRRFVFICCLLSHSVFSQVAGNWKGFVIPDGQSLDRSTIIYLEITPTAEISARSREEMPGKEGYVVKKMKGSVTGNHLELKQFVVEKKKDVVNVRWCNMELKLDFIDSTGYLQGTFISPECKGIKGKIICCRSQESIATGPTSIELQSWRPIFLDDLKKGRKSIEIRNLERKNFQFVPIYFDYDKAEIKQEYIAFLKEMIRVVNGHTDLRIKVMGNTDADGSEAYNLDLSRRRANALIAFFVSNGLSRDRIEVEFNGESKPVADNTTDAGKQLNRRVDFSFI
jgi:OOP family OmpA-OmpF porin